MIILSVRSDKVEAELGLFDNGQEIGYVKWQAHRELTKTINKKLQELLNKSSIQLKDIDGIVCFGGPGSFTGLRIGLGFANALAYSQNTPLVSAGGNTWIENGIKKLQRGRNEKIALPKYGSPANITKPKK